MRDELIEVDTVSSSAAGTSLWDALQRRWLLALAVSVTVFAGMAFSTLKKTPRYQSETLILVDYNTSVSVLPTTGNNDSSTNYEDLSTEIQILRSRPLVSRAIKKLDAPYKNISVDEVVGNLDINQADEAGILIVSYSDTDRQKIKAVLEVLGETYVRYSSERKRSRATNAIRLIEAKLPEARQALDKSSSAIRLFRKRYGIVDPESYATTVSETQQTLQEQAQEAKIAVEQTQRQEQELRRQMAQVSQDSGTAIADSVLSEDLAYQNLVRQLQETEAEYAQERARLRDAHPKMIDLKIRRQQLLNLLQRQTQVVIGNQPSQIASKKSVFGDTKQSLANQLLQVQINLAVQSTRLNSIRQAQAEAANSFQQIPNLQQNYLKLQDEFKRNSQAVNDFLEKLQELRITEAQETSTWRVLEPPYLPSTPISPNLRQGLLLGLVAGGCLGVGAAVLLERLDQRVKGVEEAKEITRIPLLGAVPKINQKVLAPQNSHRIISQRYSRSPFSEALLSLALNLQSLDSSDKLKTLAFTSASPAEGKTTIIYNLGLVLADLGKRVLIVDANMYKPSIHTLIQKSNAFGLSTAIATDRSWRKLLHSSDSQKLDVLTSGPPSRNPIALLVSEKMKQLLDEWSQVYDYVLLDTPHIIGLTEAQSIASRVDGMILVVAIEICTRPAITRAMEILQGTHCNIVGLVVNLLKEGYKGYYQPTAEADSELTDDAIVNDRHKHRKGCRSRTYRIWQ